MRRSTTLWAISLFLFCSGCENKQLIEKKKQQDIEITKISDENERLRQRVYDEKVKDPSDDIAELQTTLKSVTNEIAQINEEVEGLKAQKDTFHKDMEEYKVKYQIKNLKK